MVKDELPFRIGYLLNNEDQPLQSSEVIENEVVENKGIQMKIAPLLPPQLVKEIKEGE